MDMNRIFYRTKEECMIGKKWRVFDAKGQILGRLSTEIADFLRGKNKTDFAPHNDNGGYAIVINAKDIVLSGNKMTDKTYISVSGYIGSKKELTAKQLMAKDPAIVIHHSVRGMLPKNNLSALWLKRLKVYSGATHPHEAQITAE